MSIKCKANTWEPFNDSDNHACTQRVLRHILAHCCSKYIDKQEGDLNYCDVHLCRVIRKPKKLN